LFIGVGLDNVILNNIDAFIDSVSLVDYMETNTGLCLSSTGFPSIVLNDTGTIVFSVRWVASSTRQWD
jgi:hypothetical protein